MSFEDEHAGFAFTAQSGWHERIDDCKDSDPMTPSDSTKPESVIMLEKTYGGPSQEGFGSAVFFEHLSPNDTIERTALETYRYFVYHSLTGGGPYEQASPDPLLHTLFRDTGLEASTRYYYRVAMMDSCGNLGAWKAAPWYVLLFGGLLGVVIVGGYAFVIPRIGLAPAITVAVASQLIFSALLSHYGILGAVQQPLTMARIVGILVLLLGTWLIVR